MLPGNPIGVGTAVGEKVGVVVGVYVGTTVGRTDGVFVGTGIGIDVGGGVGGLVVGDGAGPAFNVSIVSPKINKSIQIFDIFALHYNRKPPDVYFEKLTL